MITVDIHNEFDVQLNKSSIQGLLENILLDNKHNTGSINIIMTDDDTLRRMKKEYFNQDLYTDVIAFNIDDDPFEGEIYICLLYTSPSPRDKRQSRMPSSA